MRRAPAWPVTRRTASPIRRGSNASWRWYARGYARDNEELELGVRCIAAAIRDDSGKVVAGLSISAPADFIQDEWIDQLCKTAAEISAALGYESREG